MYLACASPTAAHTTVLLWVEMLHSGYTLGTLRPSIWWYHMGMGDRVHCSRIPYIGTQEGGLWPVCLLLSMSGCHFRRTHGIPTSWRTADQQYGYTIWCLSGDVPFRRTSCVSVCSRYRVSWWAQPC